MKVKRRSVLAGIGSLVAALGVVVAAGVVVPAGSTGVPKVPVPSKVCPNAWGILGGQVEAGERLNLQNNLARPFIVKFEQVAWQTLNAGQSCNFNTGQPTATATLCSGTPVSDRGSKCDPSIQIVMHNPFIGTPRVTVGSNPETVFTVNQTQVFSATLGSQLLSFRVTRGPDIGSGAFADPRRKQWTVIVTPG